MIRRLFMLLTLAAAFGAASLGAAPAFAVNPDEMLADPRQEARARELSKDIRCLVCQNQSIDDSNADLARDLRVLVRERITEGDSDREIRDFLVARYGDFVLLSPPMRASTYALWFGPAAVLVVAGAGLAFFFRRRRTALASGADRVESLSRSERDRLQRVLDGGK